MVKTFKGGIFISISANVNRLFILTIVVLLTVSSWAIIIPEKDEDNLLSPIQKDVDVETEPSLDDKNNDYPVTENNHDDYFEVYELMYPDSEDRDMDEYNEIVRKLQEKNIANGWGNAGPPWYATPDIEGNSISYKEKITRAAAPPKDKLLVIFINFTDSGSDGNHDPEAHNMTYFNETILFNTSAGANTMHTYFQEVSYYQYNLSGKCARNSSNTNGWYTANNTEKYFGMYEMSNPAQSGYSNARGLVAQAVALADPDVNFSEYDTNKDSWVDHLMIVHAGLDDASDGNGGNNPHGDPQIWSHRGGVWLSTDDGPQVLGYTMLAEESAMGVYCHEYGHDLGLADFYNTSGGADIVWYWDVMARGSYNTYNTKDCPAHMSTWNKEFLGWHNPITINESNNNQGIKTVRATSESTNENTSFKVNLPDSNEWYYVENRWKNTSSYDAGLPDSGILIWHINLSKGGNFVTPGKWNIVNANSADGNLSVPTLIDAAWTLDDNQIVFNMTSWPRTTYNNGTSTTITMDMINKSGNYQKIRILLTPDPYQPGEATITSVQDVPADNGHAVNISWSRSDDDGIGANDVKEYHIYMNDTSEGLDGTKHLVKTVPAEGTSTYSAIVTGLEDKVSYYFGIKADDGPNDSNWSNNMSGISYDNIANPPTVLVASDTLNDDGGNITLTWTLSADDSMDIVGYNISMNDTGQGAGGGKHWLDTLPPGSTTYQIANLTNGMTYYFNVSAHDEVYNIGFSNEGSAQPADDFVDKPTGLAAVPVSWTSTNSFTLSWTNPIDNSGIAGAYYKLDSMPTTPTEGTYITGADITQILNVQVVGSGMHAVYVWLVDGEGNKNHMQWDRTYLYYDGNAPDKPKGLEVNPSNWTNINSFDINWTIPDELTNVSGVYYSIDNAPTYDENGLLTLKWNITSLSALSVSDDVNVHPIYVWLRDGVGNVDYQNSSMTTLYYDATPPAAPQNVVASPTDWTPTDDFTISWENPNDLSGIVGAYYTVGDPPTTDTSGTFVAGTDITEITNIKVVTEGEHTIYVWLVDNATNVYHLNQNTTTVYFDKSAPQPPEDILAEPSSWTSQDTFTFNWTNPSDLSGISGAFYKLGSQPLNGNEGTYIAGGGINNLTDVDVDLEGPINIFIWLNDSAGNNDYSNFNKTVFFRDTIPPEEPSEFLVLPSSWTNKNNFSVQWHNPDEVSGIGGAYYKLDAPPTKNDDGTLVTANNIKKLIDIKVEGEGEHTIYIWLVDLAGNIDYNNYNTTKFRFDSQAPGVPIGLTVDPPYWSSDNDFTAEWANPTDFSGIAGAYYKVGEQPSSDDDGEYIHESGVIKIKGIRSTEGVNDLYVWLKDAAGNSDYTKYSTTKIYYDNTRPRIIHTKVESATYYVTINIYAQIEDTYAGVRSAYIYFKTDLDSFYTEIEMMHSGNSFEGKIPSHKVSETTISYFIMAMDNSNPPNKNYFGEYGETHSNITAANDIDVAITEDDTAPPTISHTAVNSGTLNKPITLTATVHDDASGVDNVILHYRNSGAGTYQTKTMASSYTFYSATIEAESITLDGVSYFISATDTAATPNTAFFGSFGQRTTTPDAESDIDIIITSTDNTPPTITFGPTVMNLTVTSAEIFWMTDEPADSRVDYGLTQDYSIFEYEKSLSIEHRIPLTNLQPSTLHHFKVSSSDEDGNGPTTSKDNTFTTATVGIIDTDGDGLADDEDDDDDNDGIRDDKELKYGFDPKDPTDAEQDFDGDGYSNKAEILRGCDPLDRTSTPVSASDRDAPTIEHSPKIKAQKGKDIRLTAVVKDDEGGSGVMEVILNYKVEGAANYTQLKMAKMGSTNEYEAIIPKSVTEDNDKLEYFIMAADYGYNYAYYGALKLTYEKPGPSNDIDVNLVEKLEEDEGGFWDSMVDTFGAPLGIKDSSTCILILIILIIVIIAVAFGIYKASKRHEEKERELESEERYAQRQREIAEAARRTGGADPYARSRPLPRKHGAGVGRLGAQQAPADTRRMYQQDYQRPRMDTPASKAPSLPQGVEEPTEIIDFRAPQDYDEESEVELEEEPYEEEEEEAPGPAPEEEEEEEGGEEEEETADEEDDDEDVGWESEDDEEGGDEEAVDEDTDDSTTEDDPTEPDIDDEDIDKELDRQLDDIDDSEAKGDDDDDDFLIDDEDEELKQFMDEIDNLGAKIRIKKI